MGVLSVKCLVIIVKQGTKSIKERLSKPKVNNDGWKIKKNGKEVVEEELPSIITNPNNVLLSFPLLLFKIVLLGERK